jgi:transposase InsO family protein
MNEQTTYSPQALFRFTIVSQVLAGISRGERLAQTVRRVAAGEHVFFDGTARRISHRSVYRWVAAYRARGMAGLEPRRRGPMVPSHRLPCRFVNFVIHEKQRDHPASIPELIRRATERGILKPLDHVDRTTVYRTAKRLGLPVIRGRRDKDRDTRRFAFPHRMDMVLCDGKHFRAGKRRRKRVALFYLDDATRHVLHVVVGTAETACLFQRGLYECIIRHGFMSALYLDRGPGFIAQDTIAVMANLGIPLIHGEAGYKQGRGKIERFNRTVKADVLRGLDGRSDIDPACGALQLRLAHYCEKVYSQRPHESLEGDSPQQRFLADPKPPRWPQDREHLKQMFEIHIERRVTQDNVVSIDSMDYDMPRGYRGQRVILRRKLLDGTICFLHKGKDIVLLPTNSAANARAPRASGNQPCDPPPGGTTSAAHIRFERDFGPIVDRDGGFTDSCPDDLEYQEPDP